MNNIIYTFLCFFALASTPVFAQCGGDEQQVIIELETDRLPNETTLQVVDLNTNNELLSWGTTTFPLTAERLFRDTLCMPASACWEFRIQDLFGDGICCTQGNGYFKVTVDGAVVAEGSDFGTSFTKVINCPAGNGCEFPDVVTLGTYFTEVEPSHWYEFTPDTSGNYQISACFSSNTCDNRIWLYDYCLGLDYDDGLVGVFSFNDQSDCADNAEVNAFLVAGTTYYIRVGAIDGNCDNQSIEWEVSFSGMVVGCTDPLACNYNPLAQIDNGTCLYVGSPDCPEGPDLAIDEAVLRSSFSITTVVNDDPCYVQEGCFQGYGERQTINFTTRISNVGDKDFFIGETPATPAGSNNQWEWDVCHEHWHYEGYAQYLLFDDQGQQLPASFKNGFCVVDLDCPPGIPNQYTCGVQGLTAGCSDIYDAGLDCQWVDLTEVPEGRYTLAVAVNWDRSPDSRGQVETTYENNWAQVCFDLTRDPVNGTFSVVIVPPNAPCPPIYDCLGEVGGNAVADCTGQCNGSRKTGDLNEDDTRNIEDVNTYIALALDPTNPLADQCSDLNNDDQFDVMDVALILECTLHEGLPPLPGHGHAPCQFPFSITNPNDTAQFYVAPWNLDDGYFDVYLYSSTANIGAFQLSISGATIQRVTGMVNDFTASYYHTDREILAISLDEDVLPRSLNDRLLFRVEFAALTGTEVCIDQITAVVNGIREEIIPAIGSCGQLITSASENQLSSSLRLAPNPSNGAVFLHQNGQPKSLSVQIVDLHGRLVWTADRQSFNVLALPATELSAGLYFIKVSTEEQSTVLKMVRE